MKQRQVYILSLALALAFIAMAIRAFVTPDDITDVTGNSLIFKGLLEKIPVQLIGIHDAIVGLLLIFRVVPKIVTTWAAIWEV